MACSRAGRTLDASATTTIPTNAAANVAGSPGTTPNNIERSNREQRIASGEPTRIPDRHMMQLSRSTIQSTCPRRAPSAMRMPTSEVLRLTE